VRGWTGGQYSLWRIALAVYLGSHELLMGLFCLPIAFGWHARIWWAVLAVYWAVGFWWVPPGGMMLAGLIAAQLLVPDKPYLSVSRRGKSDPGTDWRLPTVAFAVALISPLLEFVRDVPIARYELFAGAVVFTLLFLLPPSLVIPPRGASELDKILYDGHCALCHGFIRFLLAEDQQGTRFHFAPLESSESAESVMVKISDGPVLIKYRAVRYLFERLGGYWRIIALGMRMVPVSAGDKMYDWIAQHRYRIFGKKADVCPLMPQALRPRFDL